MQRSIKDWTVTTNGPLASDPYFIRLSKNGDPNEALSYNVGNGGPTLDQRAVIDAGFLELVRLGDAAGRRPRRHAVAADRRRDHQDDDAAAVPAGTATTAMATATARSDGRPWAPSGPGHRPPLARALG